MADSGAFLLTILTEAAEVTRCTRQRQQRRISNTLPQLLRQPQPWVALVDPIHRTAVPAECRSACSKAAGVGVTLAKEDQDSSLPMVQVVTGATKATIRSSTTE